MLLWRRTVDHLVTLVEHLGMFVGDHSPAGSDIGGKHPGGVVRRTVERAERGIGFISRIVQADVVRRLAAFEVGIESFGGELVEALDRFFQRVGGDMDVTRQIAIVSARLMAPCSIIASGWCASGTGLRPECLPT